MLLSERHFFLCLLRESLQLTNYLFKSAQLSIRVWEQIVPNPSLGTAFPHLTQQASDFGCIQHPEKDFFNGTVWHFLCHTLSSFKPIFSASHAIYFHGPLVQQADFWADAAAWHNFLTNLAQKMRGCHAEWQLAIEWLYRMKWSIVWRPLV